MTDRDCKHGGQARVCPHCEAEITIDELRTALEIARADVALAAGELLVDIPEPGTAMSRVMLANALMRRERNEAREALFDRDATIKALREALSTALAMKDSALRRAMAAEELIAIDRRKYADERAEVLNAFRMRLAEAVAERNGAMLAAGLNVHEPLPDELRQAGPAIVYLVSDGEYSDWRVRGIYSDPVKAARAVAIFNTTNDVDEHVLDELPETPPGLLPYHVGFDRGGNVESFNGRLSVSRVDAGGFKPGFWPGPEMLSVFVWAESSEHAIKIAAEKRAGLVIAGVPLTGPEMEARLSEPRWRWFPMPLPFDFDPNAKHEAP